MYLWHQWWISDMTMEEWCRKWEISENPDSVKWAHISCNKTTELELNRLEVCAVHKLVCETCLSVGIKFKLTVNGEGTAVKVYL
jgi:hypothetical protein